MPTFAIVLILLAMLLTLLYLVGRAAKPRQEAPIEAGGARERVLADVAFIRPLVQQIPIAEERRKKLEAQLDRLEARAKRRTLHLAVIGEFNSGKSTLINGLLRQRLLKSANVATTASATTIRHGGTLQLTVRLTNGRTASANERDCSALTAALGHLLQQCPRPASLREWVDLVTVDPQVSRAVDGIDIEAPAEWLRRGICIVDTPGVGAGPEYAKHHQGVTERVLAEVADVAVVLIPADSPATRTLLDFLDSTVRPFLNRCIFVITKMDGVDQEERAGVVSHVNSVLTKFLGATPPIMEAGSLAVLLPRNEAADAGTSREYWRGEFAKLEAFLLDSMTRQGPAIIAETLIRLMHEAIDDLNVEIALRQEHVEWQKQTLEANSVMKIEQVLGRLRERCETSMNSTLAQVQRDTRSATERFEARCKRQIGEMVAEAEWGNLKETITEGIPGVLADEEQFFNESVSESFELLDRQCAESHKLFSSEFEACYRNLKSLGVAHLNRSVAAIPRSRPATGNFMQTTPFVNGPRWRDFIGIWFNKEKKREQLRTLLLPAITAHVQRPAAQWQWRISQAATAIQAELNQAVQIHLQQYSATVNEMIRERERACAALANEQRTMRAHSAALSQRAANLTELRQSLARGVTTTNSKAATATN